MSSAASTVEIGTNLANPSAKITTASAARIKPKRRVRSGLRRGKKVEMMAG